MKNSFVKNLKVYVAAIGLTAGVLSGCGSKKNNIAIIEQPKETLENEKTELSTELDHLLEESKINQEHMKIDEEIVVKHNYGDEIANYLFGENYDYDLITNLYIGLKSINDCDMNSSIDFQFENPVITVNESTAIGSNTYLASVSFNFPELTYEEIEKIMLLDILPKFHNLKQFRYEAYNQDDYLLLSDEEYSIFLNNISANTKLEVLDIKNLNMSNPHFFEKLWKKTQTLSSLTLMNVGLSDISCILENNNLTSLDLRLNNITDISSLSNLTNLKSLYLGFNNITDISSLSSLTNLIFLALEINDITDISSLSDLTNLMHLELCKNNITDISNLSSLTNLKSLHLGFNNITDISSLSSLTNLKNLNLSDNNITDISSLSNLTNLKSLYLGFNNIADISSLSSLTNLEHLDLCYNDIINIDSLLNLINLKSLKIQYNYIEHIPEELKGIVYKINIQKKRAKSLSLSI